MMRFLKEAVPYAEPYPRQSLRNRSNSPHSTTEAITDSSSSDQQVEVDGDRQSVLSSLVQAYDWANVLARVASHPSETRVTSLEGRTPLHHACELDAPAVVIQSLLNACPEASLMIGSSGMTPLHIACSSYHASIHVIRVLLDLGRPEQCQIRDLDGDTPLHTACRCGAPHDVLECLLQAYPNAVNQRDNEGLTPLLRLWVRYNVILGSRVIEDVQGPGDLTGELGDAWQKTELLLRCAYTGSVPGDGEPPGRILHMASYVDCPRSVVKMACVLYPHQLSEMDEQGRTPLMLASQAPIFKVPNLSDEGFTVLEDVVYGNESEDESDDVFDDDLEEFGRQSPVTSGHHHHPTVVSIVLQASLANGFFSALWPDKSGQLPLHAAVATGKKWGEGVKDLFEAYSEALAAPQPATGLYPFMMAAERDDLETTYLLLRSSPSLMGDLAFRTSSDNNSDRSDSKSETGTETTRSDTSSDYGEAMSEPP
jgi:Ankyrin repeats (many copies)